MPEIISKKRIFLNTGILYIRQIFSMFISFFTVRLVLKSLGQTDFGIYNIVGGFIVFFTFISNSLVSSTQRYLNVSLGKKDKTLTSEIYNISGRIYFVIATIFVFFSETIGLLLIFNNLNIPIERKNVASVIYQLSIFSTFFSILKTPAYALIVAHEKMSFFAIFDIFIVLSNFILALCNLYCVTIDHLVFYGIYIFLSNFITYIGYLLYCYKKFPESHFKKFISNKELYKKILFFSGWNLFGEVANVCNDHGITLIVNLTFGVLVNTALGLANQISNAIYNFVRNFQKAFTPQIIKAYAINCMDDFQDLILSTSKISFYLLFCIVIPVILNINDLLGIWLGEIPNHTQNFISMLLIWSLIESMDGPLYTGIESTGIVKKYQLIYGLIIIMRLPICYFLFHMGYKVEIIFVVKIIQIIILYLFTLFHLRKLTHINVSIILRDVLLKNIIIVIFALPIPLIFKYFIPSFFMKFVLIGIISFFSCVCAIFFIGLNTKERNKLLSIIRRKYNK